MSATKYQILCRYYHSSAGKVVTNSTEVQWKQAEEAHSHDASGKQVAPTVNTKSVYGKENMIIRNADYLRVSNRDNNSSQGYPMSKEYNTKLKNAKSIDTALGSIIVDEINTNNPKYDMVFLYDGITTCEGAEATNANTKYVLDSLTAYSAREVAEPLTTPPIVYYEKMKRLEGPAPWFIYATASSLKAIMKKAEELVDIMGKDNVIIGKVVELDEYIDIN